MKRHLEKMLDLGGDIWMEEHDWTTYLVVFGHFNTGIIDTKKMKVKKKKSLRTEDRKQHRLKHDECESSSSTRCEGVKVFLQVQFTVNRLCDPNSSTRRHRVCKSRKQMSSSGESDSGNK